jgi:hypothetical protein
MGKLYDDYNKRSKTLPGFITGNSLPVSREEFDALRSKVTALEERYQKSNAMTPAEKQRAYRERKKTNG